MYKIKKRRQIRKNEKVKRITKETQKKIKQRNKKTE